ncbi:hypothetical protein [Paraburkholderia sp. RL17-337-BIB-A]|uniref:hypothetical protein n=1 Tax=Paraburkholderia sp. RL17-337-BIB-A TaxID=3031636 RepID=UPI0038B9533B
MNNADEVLRKMAALSTTNTKTVSMLGARSIVLGAFLDATLPHLTTSQRAAVIRSFRQGIEDALTQMDDISLPAEYHSTLLGLTNAILAALDQESATQG